MTWEKTLAIAASIATIAAFFGLNISDGEEESDPSHVICKSVETDTGVSTSCSSSE